jgi:tRNA threonylcarbamoyladenosine biosynthesis protein TsaB
MLLAVDTSTSQIGLALVDGAQVLAEFLWTGKARHSIELAPAVEKMLGQTGVKINQLKALGVATGPGSFTSLRVGLSFVKGLALACSLPVIGINTLDVIAASQAGSPLPLACLLPAGRGRLALGWYHSSKPGHNHAHKSAWVSQGSPQIITAVDLSTSIEQDTIVCGDLSAVERQLLKKNPHAWLVSPALSVRRPAILAELAYARWQAGQVDDVSSLAPVYLHIAEPIPDFAASPAVPSRVKSRDYTSSEGHAAKPSAATPRVFVRRMSAADLPAVTRIDQGSFQLPWPAAAFEVEMLNLNSRCWVAEVAGQVVAILVIWRVLDEAHIATIAVDPGFRQAGVGKLLLQTGMQAAYAEGARIYHLEVRASNLAAQKMYTSFGFEIVGKRPKYYKDNGEDALLMSLLPSEEPPLWIA